MAKEFSLVLVVMLASCSVMEVSFDVMAAMAVSRVAVECDERERASLVVTTGVVETFYNWMNASLSLWPGTVRLRYILGWCKRQSFHTK